MTATTNGTPTDDWTLVVSATGTGTLSISSDDYDLHVVTHTSGSTPPAATLKGHTVKIGNVLPIGLKNGDHIWQRIRPTADVGKADHTPTVATTVQY